MVDPVRFSVPANYDPALVAGVADLGVEELYGKVEGDGFGGGRPSYLVQKVGWKLLSRHVAEARAAGIGFNYLLNAADAGTGDITTSSGYARLRRLLDRLVATGVTSVTVVSPYALRIVRAHTPLAVRVSVFARVDDEKKARAWFDEGASRIVLDSMLVNRDPDRLKRIAEASAGRGDLELLVNNRCEIGCAWAPCHAVDLGAASRRSVPSLDACYLQCQARFLSQPARLLAQDWIRPEDLGLYEALGYRFFKIAGRGCTTAQILARVRAYEARRHEGDFMDLLRRGPVRIGAWSALATLITGGWRHALGLSRVAGPATRMETAVRIENRALDGYLESLFRRGGCRPGQCAECDICERWAARAVKVEAGMAETATRLDRALVDGGIWER